METKEEQFLRTLREFIPALAEGRGFSCTQAGESLLIRGKGPQVIIVPLMLFANVEQSRE